MVFEHRVVHNGIAYPAGTDVPIEDSNGEGVKAPAVNSSGKVDTVKDDKVVITDDKKPKYTEEDLDVPFFSLKSLAKKEGLKLPDKATTSEIRDMLRAL